MSDFVGFPSDYNFVSRLASDSAVIKQQLDTLAAQASSGKVSDSYAGLGTSAKTSLDLRPQMAEISTWQTNINAVSARMQSTQSVLSQLQQIAQTTLTNINSISQATSGGIASIAAEARGAMTQVAQLLNTQVGGIYVFGGQNTSSPPIPGAADITSSPFFNSIGAAVGQLGTLGGFGTAAATLAAADDSTQTPFSQSLGSAAPMVEVGEGQTVLTGIVANVNAAAVQTGSSTTGSYTTDLLRALATLGSLTEASGTAGGGQPLADLLSDTRQSLQGVVSAIAVDSGVLGARQDALSAASTTLSDANKSLQTQVSSIEDVDMAKTLSDITSTQTQLQASYKLISEMSTMSLAQYLPAS